MTSRFSETVCGTSRRITSSGFELLIWIDSGEIITESSKDLSGLTRVCLNGALRTSGFDIP